MRDIKYYFIFALVSSVVIFGYVGNAGKDTITLHKKMDNNFIGETSKFGMINVTVINLDDTLSDEGAIIAIQDVFLPNFLNITYVNGIKNQVSIIRQNVSVSGVFGMEQYNMPMGEENYTAVIIGPNDPVTQWRIVNHGGAAVGKRCYLLHYPDDDSIELGIRLMHEIEHTFKLNADGMDTEFKDQFREWLQMKNHKFKYYYELDNMSMPEKLSYYSNNGRQQTLLDFHLWLLTRD